MTFTLKIKDELSNQQLNEMENRYLLLGYLYLNNTLQDDKIYVSLENLLVAKKLYKTFKYCYKVEPKVTVRMQKKFKMQKLYIFEIEKNCSKEILYELNNLIFADRENIISFLKGIFLVSGSISDPKKNRYHLEINVSNIDKANYISKLLLELNLNFKIISRTNGYMLYLKSSEEISDFLKYIETVNSLFYFEDIRIYRDHKNMVNRLNNCEQANYEKSLKTSDSQSNMIKFLKEKGYFSLLDEKTILVAEVRQKYPEESYQGLASILSSELGKNVTKSYVNHHLRKINEIYIKAEKIEKK